MVVKDSKPLELQASNKLSDKLLWSWCLIGAIEKELRQGL